MLYYFFPKLKVYKKALKNSTHFNLLVNYIKDIYALTKQRFILLQNSEKKLHLICFRLFLN